MFRHHLVALLCSSTKRRTIEFNDMNIKHLCMLSHDQEIQWTNLITLTDFSKLSTVPHLPVYTNAIMSHVASSNLEQHQTLRYGYQNHEISTAQTCENRRT